MSQTALPQIETLSFTPEEAKLFAQGRPAGPIAPKPAPAPPHAAAEDPALLAVKLVEQAVAKAAKQVMREVDAELPSVLDRLAARRYAWIILAAGGALLGAGFGLGLLYSAQGWACDGVSSPGWRHCWQLSGVPPYGMAQRPVEPAKR